MTSTPRRGRGRPLKPAAEHRSHFLAVKLTEAEYAELVDRANAAVETVSDYVRRVLLARRRRD